MKNITIYSFILLITTVSFSSLAWGQVPTKMSFQGVLTNDKGEIVSDATYSVTFTIYDVKNGGTKIWEETQQIQTMRGMFTVLLGDKTAIKLPFDKPYFVSLKVGADPESKDRIELVSTAYSFRADTANVAKFADKLTGGGSGGGFTLPYNGKNSMRADQSPGYLFRIQNTGAGGAGEFVTDTLGAIDRNPTLHVSWSGIGNQAALFVEKKGGDTPAFMVNVNTNTAGWSTGGAARLSILDPQNPNTVLETYTSGDGEVIYAYKNGGSVTTKSVAHFYNGRTSTAPTLLTESDVDGSALKASNTKGVAAEFTTTTSSLKEAVNITAAGTGPALKITSNATQGSVQIFDNNTTVDHNAMYIKSNSPLDALRVDYYGNPLAGKGYMSSVFGKNYSTNTTAMAGLFINDTTSGSTYSALSALTQNKTSTALIAGVDNPQNSKEALFATTIGTGYAGYFNQGNNATNASPALYCQGRSANVPTFVVNQLGAGSNDNNALIAQFQAQGQCVASIYTNGNFRSKGTFTSNGCDIAEGFKVSGVRFEYEPGDVLEINPAGKRMMRKSGEQYSSLVAGVYATKPGVLLSEQNIEDTEDMVPMGVVGVIPTKVCIENGDIRAGDLLVSSSIPGVAMKGTDRTRMLGAIIGKALEAFSGKGVALINVMVNVK